MCLLVSFDFCDCGVQDPLMLSPGSEGNTAYKVLYDPAPGYLSTPSPVTLFLSMIQ